MLTPEQLILKGERLADQHQHPACIPLVKACWQNRMALIEKRAGTPGADAAFLKINREIDGYIEEIAQTWGDERADLILGEALDIIDYPNGK